MNRPELPEWHEGKTLPNMYSVVKGSNHEIHISLSNGWYRINYLAEDVGLSQIVESFLGFTEYAGKLRDIARTSHKDFPEVPLLKIQYRKDETIPVEISTNEEHFREAVNNVSFEDVESLIFGNKFALLLVYPNLWKDVQTTEKAYQIVIKSWLKEPLPIMEMVIKKTVDLRTADQIEAQLNRSLPIMKGSSR